ncbi:outer membrane protein transport protein [Sulfitobacter albidus]|uniref:Outer membrane protein transport protein n=1 Tax=Sulfitobacter albidus TaxID=2829501 RepID=A0A975JFP5_9RHOB|nr:outer membrane protein transport protein [Sulfitobacter albidus]QUJ77603.1 outer membrane protein transport protein [Sulfitobacter albidus]
MKIITAATGVIIMSTLGAQAGGLDRSGQDIDIIFETDNRLELSFGTTRPSIDGTENGSTGTAARINNVGDGFNLGSGALRYNITDQIAVAVVVDEPYGTDIAYGGNPAASALGGTSATVDSFAITAIGRYKFDDRFSVHGGIRYQEIEADVTLGGLGFGGLNGYRGSFASDGAVGYLVGAAYEIPDIALRVALTYNSEITHDLRTTETIGGVPVAPASVTEITAPESLNLSFQSGIAEGTLVFGSVRYARYADTRVSPAFFDSAVNPGSSGDSLTDIEDSVDLEIGIGRQFTDRFAGSISIGYSATDSDDLTSPLAPVNGSRNVSIGGSYKLTQDVTLSGGVRYTSFGDARPATSGAARADFDSNSAVSAGFKIAYSF